MDSKTTLRPIEAKDVAPLCEMAKRDGHDLWHPTHIIERDGETLGSVSVDGIPMCTVYLSAEVSNPFIVRGMGKAIDEEIAKFGDKGYFICSGADSPVARLMPAGGYTGFNTMIWHKGI